MEASMHGPFDKTPKAEQNIYQNWSMKLFALPLLAAYRHPRMSEVKTSDPPAAAKPNCANKPLALDWSYQSRNGLGLSTG